MVYSAAWLGTVGEVDRIAAHMSSRFPKPWRIDDASDCGVLTAADATFFPGLQLLFYSAGGHVPLAVVDLGMDQAQLAWCSTRMKILPRSGPMPEGVEGWQCYNKAFFISASPFRYTLWCDADCLIVDDLSDLFASMRKAPLLIRHCDSECYEPHNAEELYNYLPVPTRLPAGEAINAGVLGFDLQRDSAMLSTWRWIISRLAFAPELREMVTWYDEGALHWVIQRLNLINFICPRLEWNRLAWTDARSALALIDLLVLFPGNTVLHFAGRPKPWSDWRQRARMIF